MGRDARRDIQRIGLLRDNQSSPYKNILLKIQVFMDTGYLFKTRIAYSNNDIAVAKKKMRTMRGVN